VNKLKTKSVAKRVTIAGVACVFLLAFVSITPALAKKPLIGYMNLEFNLAWLPALGGPGYQKVVPDWVGEITIGEKTYGMLFFAFETGKPFDDPTGNSNRLFFGEIWAIYDVSKDEFPDIPNNNFDDWDDWNPETCEDCVMYGYDAGLTNLANSKYHMGGYVIYANGDFAGWEGRRVHMSGLIEWYPNGAPYKAPGILRLN
jgi:hypothetical protein